MKERTQEEKQQTYLSPPARGAWIEILRPLMQQEVAAQSPPARGAWIEIKYNLPTPQNNQVAPRTGGVD